LTFTQLKIYYEEHGKPLNEQFASTLEFSHPSRRTVARAIKTLTENKVIARIGSKKTGHWEIAINKD